jgi:importin-11
MSLCNHYSAFVVPMLLKTLQQVLGKIISRRSSALSFILMTKPQAAPTDNLTKILQKEAMYCAIGRCAIRLQSAMNFDEWLQTHLISEAQASDPE